ncbi:MAG: 30S ribosomal protein S9 [Verrucomicrobiales bacterium]|jgi:small subunit ribosomal protein S9|nr:30S ribosomal protein S9 [Verrucomicrobiales bacterium]MBP9223904.1 30S ribosomal protein S9 [Verrucomicrobiales bacterium]HQZ29642.1 30S ribosomal protein S9 [Verrucomicrobiales bacterium]
MSASFSATGRRKTASARVTLVPGTGQITINKRAFEEYFGTLSMQNKVLHPFQVANVTNQFDAVIAANGGGVTGQIGAIQLGIARALLKSNSELRDSLREVDLLTRDPRKKERKKPGQPKARKRFQFSKR